MPRILKMTNLILTRISPQLIAVLKKITKILNDKGKKPTKKMVCDLLYREIVYHSNIMENIKNAK